MSRALTYKPKKNRAMSRAFNFLSYFPNALGNFLLLRPINQTEIMKPYINDESIDLQDEAVRKKLEDKLLYDQIYSMLPIPGLKELLSNQQRTDFRNESADPFMPVFFGIAGGVWAVTTISLFTAGAPLLGAAAFMPVAFSLGRIVRLVALKGENTDKVIKKIADKRAKNHKKRLAYLKEPPPFAELGKGKK